VAVARVVAIRFMLVGFYIGQWEFSPYSVTPPPIFHGTWRVPYSKLSLYHSLAFCLSLPFTVARENAVKSKFQTNNEYIPTMCFPNVAWERRKLKKHHWLFI
jgi:hypothetical protein